MLAAHKLNDFARNALLSKETCQKKREIAGEAA